MSLEARDDYKTVRALAASADHALDQLDRFVAGLSDEEYTACPPPSTSCIGGHVRHTLDHYATLLKNATATHLDYDDRERGGAIENETAAARGQIADLRGSLKRLAEDVSGGMTLKAVIAADGNGVDVPTSFQRELLFVFSHTVHHCALMAIIAKLQGANVPEDFGYAPATLHFLSNA